MAQRSIVESVKVASAGRQFVDTSLHGVKIPIYPGKDEVAILLSYKIQAIPGGIGPTLAAGYLLWRKSDKDWPAPTLDSERILQQKGVIAGGILHWDGVGGSGGNLSESFMFPYPIVLVRPPQLVMEVFNNTGDDVDILLQAYYLIEKVSKAELQEIMVKDHA